MKNEGGYVSKYIMNMPCISITAKAVYAFLCANAGDERSVIISNDTICKKLKISKNSLSKYMKELINNKIIIKKQLEGCYSINTYFINTELFLYSHIEKELTPDEKKMNAIVDSLMKIPSEMGKKLCLIDALLNEGDTLRPEKFMKIIDIDTKRYKRSKNRKR